MIYVNVLDNHRKGYLNKVPPYWYPVYLNARYLRDIGIKLRFFEDIREEIHDCDVLFLSSRYFHLEGKGANGKERLLKRIASLNDRIGKTVWFDMRDSTGNTQFEVLPYVTSYLKKQLLKEKRLYRNSFYGNRIYTDFFHQQFGIEDVYEEKNVPLFDEDEEKIGLSWNPGLLDYRGGGRLRKVFYLLGDRFEAKYGVGHRLPFRRYSEIHDVNLMALFSTNYARETVKFQRKKAIEILDQLNDKSGIIYKEKLPLQKYIEMASRARIVLSLFGWGELSSRDYQCFIAGSALIMPDVSHLETWPDLYIPRETYWPVEWDLANLEESYRYLLNNEAVRQHIARTGQGKYLKQWSREGRRNFCERLKLMLSAL